MASIRLNNVTKHFKTTTAIRDLNLKINDGEFFCVLGPPGAGKTTLLRLIVGLERPEIGSIEIGDDDVSELHPSKRDIAMIFQNLALYPDKTVFENIAFPLRVRKMDEEAIQKKVIKVAKELKIDWLLEKTPAKLSGGERQRVAIGRAIIRKPRVYLMDEPLSNLDAILRLEMRITLKALQTDLNETFVYVTHDQVEALSMGDRIAVLNEGKLQQVDTPEKIYKLPENTFVANILGSPPMNFIPCNADGQHTADSITHECFEICSTNDSFKKLFQAEGEKQNLLLGVRPEDISIHHQKETDDGIAAEIYVVEPLGNETVVDIKLGNSIIKVLADADFLGTSGEKVWISLRQDRLHFFDEDSGQCLLHTSEDSVYRIAPHY
jgi:multiple sugar transport system ATP-binding protein